MDLDHLSDDDIAVVAEALAWLRELDLATVSPRTRESIAGVFDTLTLVQELEACAAPRAAITFMSKVATFQLVAAQVRHERETGACPPAEDPISADEFRRRYIAPMHAEACKVVRVMRRQARTRGRSRCQARPRPRARRAAARRALGVRSGNDPGDDGPARPTSSTRALQGVRA